MTNTFIAPKRAFTISKGGQIAYYSSIADASRANGIHPDDGRDIVRGKRSLPASSDILVMCRHHHEAIVKLNQTLPTDYAMTIFNALFNHYESDSDYTASGSTGRRGPNSVKTNKFKGYTLVWDDGSTDQCDSAEELADLLNCSKTSVSHWSLGRNGFPRTLPITAIIRNIDGVNRSYPSSKQPYKDYS